MKTIVAFMIAAGVLFSAPASARDTRHMFSIAEALIAEAAKKRIDKDVKLYFGNRSHPAVARKIGTFTANKKTNAYGKSDKEACEWAFLSVVLQLQERARLEGGNAVVNIRSYYKKNSVSHTERYMCGAGGFIAGVAFQGDVVRLAD